MFYRTLAVLPALVGAWQDRGGGLSRSVGSYHDAVVDEAALRATRPVGRPDAAHDQHEPARRGADRSGARTAGRGADRVEQQPAGHRPERRADPSGPRAGGPVPRRPRAVPHRHRALRRHRAPGDDAAGVHRCRAGVGPPVDGLERGGHRAAWRVVQQHRAVPPARRGDGAGGAGAVRRRRHAARRRAGRGRRPRRAGPTSAGGGCRTPRTVDRGPTGCSRRRRARSNWSARR